MVSGAGIGTPTTTVIGNLSRPNDFGWSFVHARCAPQTISGMIGACASSAIRAAPVLNSFSSKLRLMVASGYTPTISPSRSS